MNKYDTQTGIKINPNDVLDIKASDVSLPTKRCEIVNQLRLLSL